MRTEEEQQQARLKNMNEIKRKIRNSDETITVLGRVVKCIDADSVSGYRFTGSGLVFYAGKVIERVDWSDKTESQQAKESNMDEKYQGYTNYETWNAALHIANDSGLYHYCQDMATDIKDLIENGECDQVNDGIWTPAQAARFLLADAIEATLRAHPLADTTSMYSDILTHALGQVDWHEVADSVLEE